MKARIRHDYRTCELCIQTVTEAVVISEARTATICVTCWEKALLAVERAKRKDERDLFTTNH